MDDLLREFLAETSESLDKVDNQLVRFEQEPNNAKILDNVFRLVHTIKGTCGFLGLPRLETLSHAAETVMGRFREGMPVTGEAVTLILATIDRIKDILSELERAQQEPEGGDADLIHSLEQLARGEQPAPGLVASALPAARAGEEEEPFSDERQRGATIRVAVDTIEKLMTLVSELVLTRNQLLDASRRQSDAQLKLPLQRLSTVTAELQAGVTKTRMQPIGNAWQNLPRLVRDLAADLGKEIELVTTGADTELDRQVLELIKDPLTHMVRNAADHGLESAQERRAAGKPEKGTIRLCAHHEGGHIVIEVSDDGRGLDLERIKSKAVALGLVQQTALQDLSEAQVHKLIFNPGFSTAARITSISGRGVGMDVVKTNIDRIGGTIEARSVRGEGTRFTVKIPLTLAIVSALIVEDGGERFAIPQVAVVELVPVQTAGEHRVEHINDTGVLRLRDTLLPLVQLSELFAREAQTLRERNSGFVVVAQVGRQRFGIVLDNVVQTEEIVVKPLSRKLRHIGLFSGTTILGDGSVILIIDPNGVAEAIGAARAGGNEQAAPSEEATASADTVPLLLFRAASGSLKAVPVPLLSRIEEVSLDAIERSDGRTFLQYHGRLMPLVEFVGQPEPAVSTAKQRLLVLSQAERSVGLLVDEIVDIVEDAVEIDAGSSTPGIMGAAIIGGRATEIVDVDFWLNTALAESASKKTVQAAGRTAVMLVDDSSFFRGLLGTAIEAAGYALITASSADDALAQLERGVQVAAVLCDLKLAGAGGLQLAQRIRASIARPSLPLVALDTHAGPAKRAQLRNAGFDAFVAKFDRPGLIKALAGVLPMEAAA